MPRKVALTKMSTPKTLQTPIINKTFEHNSSKINKTGRNRRNKICYFYHYSSQLLRFSFENNRYFKMSRSSKKYNTILKTELKNSYCFIIKKYII